MSQTGASRTDLESRLRTALRAAMSARDPAATAALRSALGALGNASAVPLVEGVEPQATTSPHIAGAVGGLAGTEAPRRQLTADEQQAIMRAEVADRRAAAEHMMQLGRTVEGERYLAEAAALRTVLDAD